MSGHVFNGNGGNLVVADNRFETSTTNGLIVREFTTNVVDCNIIVSHPTPQG